MTGAPTYNLSGEKLAPTPLPDKVFGVAVNPRLLAQAVRVYLANQRRGAASTKTRAQVAKTSAKMYRQKGTGRARHGAASAPIFVGGGVAHGPTGEQNWRLRLPAKMRRLALKMALSTKAAAGKIVIVVGTPAASGQTRQVAGLLAQLNLPKTALLLTTPDQGKIKRGAANLPSVTIAQTSHIHPWAVLSCRQLLLTKEALTNLTKQYA